ncbi:MAG: GNAT family N-acetyltransferase [Thermoflexibacter sp.]|jgi:predicted acetyltransferase|nr:GNAT family N-acetyltransferase [Thermoflexibacter sp.]
MNIIEISERTDLIDKVVDYFWKCWGNDNNFKFYQDCILNSLEKEKKLPKFYIVLNKNEIIASYALLTNDIISRQDLYPWLACLFVNPKHRNKGIAEQLLIHGLQETKNKGFDRLYLSSDLENFYERKGWTHITNGFNIFDTEIKIYSKQT